MPSWGFAHVSEVDLQVGADLAIYEPIVVQNSCAGWLLPHPAERYRRHGESGVREAMVRSGFIDTKVAAVSKRLTALRFNQQRQR